MVFVIFPVFIADIGPRYPFHSIHELLHKTLDGVGLEYVDLMPYCEGHDYKRLALVPGKDPHPSETGHRVAAEALWIELRNRGLVPSSKDAAGNWVAYPKTSPYLRPIFLPPGGED